MLKLATKFEPKRGHFERAYGAGFRFAEFWLGPRVLEQVDAVLDMARAYPLRYALHFPNRSDLADQHLQAVARLYRETDSEVLVMHEPQWRRYGDRMQELEPELCMAVENHRLNPAEFDHWAATFPALTLDIEHLWKFTLQDAPFSEWRSALESFLQDFGDKLRHVHLPGYLPGWPEHRPMYASREFVFASLDLLKDAGYDGLVVSEADCPYQNPAELRMDWYLFEAWRSGDAHSCRPTPGRSAPAHAR